MMTHDDPGASMAVIPAILPVMVAALAVQPAGMGKGDRRQEEGEGGQYGDKLQAHRITPELIIGIFCRKRE